MRGRGDPDYLAYQHRRRRAANLMRGLLEDYFEEKNWRG
jgi:hypothetical protein